LSVVGIRRVSIVFREVPASEPWMPLLAKAARTAVVVCRSRPALRAPGPTWARACRSESTEALEALAPPARAFATCPASLARRPNMFRVLATDSAAEPSSSSPAAARSMVALSAPALIWAGVMPLLASSSMAAVASWAENMVE